MSVFAGLVGLGVSGCGPGRERGTRSGTVTFQEKPVTEGVVIFSDDSQAVFMRFDLRPDGTFEVKTSEGKGIWTGTYRVGVAPPLAQPEMGKGKAAPRTARPFPIPSKYWKPETSGIVVEIKEGANDPLLIDLKP